MSFTLVPVSREDFIDRATFLDELYVEQEFLLEEGNIIFREEFDNLSSKERIIVLALAKGSKTPKAIAKDVGEKVSNINRFLSYLKEKGYIYREEKGIYRIDDPVFSRWVEGLSQ